MGYLLHDLGCLQMDIVKILDISEEKVDLYASIVLRRGYYLKQQKVS